MSKIILFFVFLISSLNVFGAQYSYHDPKEGFISLELTYAPSGLYLYADPAELEVGNYSTPNNYDYSSYFQEAQRDYVVNSVWELTDRGDVAFYTDDRSDFAISGGILKIQEHQNYVNLEGLLNPTQWLEILDQFVLYHSYSGRNQAYLDIFEKMLLSPAGFNHLDGDFAGVFELEQSWITSLFSSLQGDDTQNKITNFKNAIAADTSGELSIYEWLNRIGATADLYHLATHLKDIEKSIGGTGVFLDSIGVFFDALQNANTAARKQKIIAGLFLARNITNVDDYCYAFSEAAIGNTDPAYQEAWDEFFNAYCVNGGYFQLYADISDEISKDLLIINSVTALETVVSYGVTKYLVAKGLATTNLALLKVMIVKWAVGEVIDGVKILTDLDQRSLKDALISHIFNTLAEKIQAKDSAEFRHIGVARDILSLKRLQSSLMVYIWSDYKAFIENSDPLADFSSFVSPMVWATYAGIGISGAETAINENYTSTVESSKILYSPNGILQNISALVQLEQPVDKKPIVVLGGSSYSGLVNDSFTVDASGSYDPEGMNISAYWSLLLPDKSSSSLSSNTSLSPSITVDVPGVYVLTLIVSDGTNNSTPATVTIYVYPEPVDGHDLIAQTFSTNSSADPGDTIYFDISVQNSGIYDEDAKIEILVVGPGVNTTIGPINLGSVQAGYITPRFNGFASYTFSSGAQDGYYSFKAKVYSEAGDENWQDNYSAEVVSVGIEPQPIKTNAYEYDHFLVSWNGSLSLPDEYTSGGFGWITYNGYKIAFSPFSSDDETFVHIKNPSDVDIEVHDRVRAGRGYLYDNGKLMIKYDFYSSFQDAVVIELGKAAPNTVTLNPPDAHGIVGVPVIFDIDLGRQGECCFNNDIYPFYSGNYFYKEDDTSYASTIVEADGTIRSFGWEMEITPLAPGFHEFVLQLDGDGDIDYYVFGELTVTDPPSDSDNDGVLDEVDAFPNDPAASVDSDGDGYPDAWNTGKTEVDSTTGLILDLFPEDPLANIDSDSDGVADYYDAFSSDPNESFDTDGDGIGDNSDKFPADPAASVDTDGDGYPDAWNPGKSEVDSTMGLILDEFPVDGNEWEDTDGDGIGDNADKFPADPAASVDADGDGYPGAWNPGNSEVDSTTGLILDEFPVDGNEWGDTDGDGNGDNNDWAPFDRLESQDTDGDGVGDNSDWAPRDSYEWLDSDGDGVGDNADVAPLDPRRNSNNPPEIDEIITFTLIEGQYLEFQVNATDADYDSTIIELTSAPSFVYLVGNNLIFTPSFSNVGEHGLFITAYDNFGGIDNAHITVGISTCFGDDIELNSIAFGVGNVECTGLSTIEAETTTIMQEANVIFTAPETRLGKGFRIHNGGNFRVVSP